MPTSDPRGAGRGPCHRVLPRREAGRPPRSLRPCSERDRRGGRKMEVVALDARNGKLASTPGVANTAKGRVWCRPGRVVGRGAVRLISVKIVGRMNAPGRSMHRPPIHRFRPVGNGVVDLIDKSFEGRFRRERPESRCLLIWPPGASAVIAALSWAVTTPTNFRSSRSSTTGRTHSRNCASPAPRVPPYPWEYSTTRRRLAPLHRYNSSFYSPPWKVWTT